MSEIKLSELRAIVEAMSDAGEWRQGTSETHNVFVHDDTTLGGTCGERVVLRANTNFTYVSNVASVVALHNAAPVLLEIAEAAMAWALNFGSESELVDNLIAALSKVSP